MRSKISFRGGWCKLAVNRGLANIVSQEGTLETLSKSQPTRVFYPEGRIDWVPALVLPDEEKSNEESAEA